MFGHWTNSQEGVGTCLLIFAPKDEAYPRLGLTDY